MFISYLSIVKLLVSALANGRSKFGADKLWFVSEVRVDEGPCLKRFRPHAQGRGFPIKKRMSHITS